MRSVSWLIFILLSGSLQGCFPVIPSADKSAPTSAPDEPMTAQEQGAEKNYTEDEQIAIDSAAVIDRLIVPETHVNVSSYKRKVLITGEVPNEETKARIGQLVSDTRKVLGVKNELVISPNSSPVSRNFDRLITEDVKRRLFQDSRIIKQNSSVDHILVVSENATVFLRGALSHAEGSAAAEVALDSLGVKRVVQLFDFID